MSQHRRIENHKNERKSIFERLVERNIIASDNLTIEMSRPSITSTITAGSEAQHDGQPPMSDAGRSGMCFPYNDFFVMSSQILSIMATIALWMNMRTLFMSVFAMVVHQIVVWSYHMEKISIRALPVVSFLASFALFSHGMITLVMLILDTMEDLSHIEQDAKVDGCTIEIEKVILAFCAFLGSLFWMGSFLCMNSFVERGRNAQWQALVLAATESDNMRRRRSGQHQIMIAAGVGEENEIMSDSSDTDGTCSKKSKDAAQTLSSEGGENELLLVASESIYSKKKEKRRKKRKESLRIPEGDENV